MSDYLGCKTCPHVVEVSEEDADASFSDAINHQMTRHGVRDWQIAARNVTEVTR